MTEFRLWILAWLTLCAALAFHIFEEAPYVREFGPTIAILRDLFPWLPAFKYQFWLFNSVGTVVVLIALTWQVYRRNPWMWPASYAFGFCTTVLATMHILWSLSSGSMIAPWMTAAPLLLAASFFLLSSIPRSRQPREAA